MSLENLTIIKSGAFVFRKPTRATAKLDRELLVVFSAPAKQLCSIVLTDGQTTPKTLGDMLENAFQKLLEHLESKDSIETKVFGASHGDASLLETALAWLNQHGLKPVAKDVGKYISRKAIIDCATGRVGIEYGIGRRLGLPEFVTPGSARKRISPDSEVINTLVLCKNRVHAHLAVQAIEEHRNYRAQVPLHPGDFAVGKPDLSPYQQILLFDDWATHDEIHDFINQAQEQHPKLKFLWAGEVQPLFLSEISRLLILPRLVPEFLIEFKAALKQTVRDSSKENQIQKNA